MYDNPVWVKEAWIISRKDNPNGDEANCSLKTFSPSALIDVGLYLAIVLSLIILYDSLFS